MSSDKSMIGVVGLGVMGQNLALNIERNGFSVSVFDLESQRIQEYLSTKASGKSIQGAESIAALADSLESPRRILMMVPAGRPVDLCIESLLPHLDPGDILIDGGNSHYEDTNRRTRDLVSKGFNFVGAGVSGGEEGALNGPSIMPGGSFDSWQVVKPILQAIAAKTDDGDVCCDWVGDEGAGHFVKMIHNGIEYGDMQLICEAYHLMKCGLGMSHDEMADTFSQWDDGELNSYLIEITAEILRHRDSDGNPVVEQIQDIAGQKGTGRWTVSVALELGQPLTLISEAVLARNLSSLKGLRQEVAGQLSGPSQEYQENRDELLKNLEQALYASKVVSYAQGYQVIHAAAKEYGWKLNYGSIALLWRAGCIIRSAFLGRIKEGFDRNPALSHLLLDPFFGKVVTNAQPAWRHVVSTGVQLGIPMPAMNSALVYYDGFRYERLPANLLQAQRDYFGAHTYERVDKPRGEFYHTDWIGDGQEHRIR